MIFGWMALHSYVQYSKKGDLLKWEKQNMFDVTLWCGEEPKI